MRDNIKNRFDKFSKLSMDEFEMLDFLKEKLGEDVSSDKSLILYASETGNAMSLA